MIWDWNTVQTILFTVLCICFIFYLLMGISTYNKENRLRSNMIFFYLCIASSLWAIGFAFMLIAPNVLIANSWRILSALGWCYFNGLLFAFVVAVDESKSKYNRHGLQLALLGISTFFFATNLMFAPEQIVGIMPFGYADSLYTATPVGIVFAFYNVILIIVSIGILFVKMKKTPKNRVKKQLQIIFITSLITVVLAVSNDFMLPPLGLSSIHLGLWLFQLQWRGSGMPLISIK